MRARLWSTPLQHQLHCVTRYSFTWLQLNRLFGRFCFLSRLHWSSIQIGGSVLNTEHDSLRFIVHKTLNERMNGWAAVVVAATAANCYQLFQMHTPKKKRTSQSGSWTTIENNKQQHLTIYSNPQGKEVATQQQNKQLSCVRAFVQRTSIKYDQSFRSGDRANISNQNAQQRVICTVQFLFSHSTYLLQF